MGNFSMSDVDQSSLVQTGTVAEDFEQRTSKSGTVYYVGAIESRLDERNDEPVFFRAFGFQFPFRNGVPSSGERVLFTGSLSQEREGGIGLRLNSIEVIGQGSVYSPEEVDDLPF